MATHHLPATDRTVHWGFWSRLLSPLIEVESGDVVTIETLTHHANDDAARMIQGDPGAESVYRWDRQAKAVDRRGAGPMEPTRFGRGAGEGHFGVTQVVDGNWGVHAIIRKSLFAAG